MNWNSKVKVAFIGSPISLHFITFSSDNLSQMSLK